MKAFERKIPGLVDLHDRVAARPNIKAYLASERRIPFNEDGIFRRYKELDVSASVIPGCSDARPGNPDSPVRNSGSGSRCARPGMTVRLPVPSVDRRHRQLRQLDAVDAADIERHHLGAVGLGAARKDLDAAVDAELVADGVLVEEIFAADCPRRRAAENSSAPET